MRNALGRKERYQLLLVQGVTLSRAAACIVFACLARLPSHVVIATYLYLYATLSDVADGWLARKLACCTAGGAALDWFGDKYLNFVSMLFAYSSGVSALPCILVILRDLLVQAFRDVRVGDAKLFPPKRLIGALTGLPVRLATILLLLNELIGIPWTIIELLFWLAGLTSLACLLMALRANWDLMLRVFRATRQTSS